MMLNYEIEPQSSQSRNDPREMWAYLLYLMSLVNEQEGHRLQADAEALGLDLDGAIRLLSLASEPEEMYRQLVKANPQLNLRAPESEDPYDVALAMLSLIASP